MNKDIKILTVNEIISMWNKRMIVINDVDDLKEIIQLFDCGINESVKFYYKSENIIHIIEII